MLKKDVLCYFPSCEATIYVKHAPQTMSCHNVLVLPS